MVGEVATQARRDGDEKAGKRAGPRPTLMLGGDLGRAHGGREPQSHPVAFLPRARGRRARRGRGAARHWQEVRECMCAL
jgi:hypothetical protein